MVKEKDDKPHIRLFHMTIEQAMEFYKRCMDERVAEDNINRREEILMELAKEGGICISDYKKPVEEILDQFSKNYGKVLYVKKPVKELPVAPTDCMECGESLTLMGKGWICINASCTALGEVKLKEEENDAERG